MIKTRRKLAIRRLTLQRMQGATGGFTQPGISYGYKCSESCNTCSPECAGPTGDCRTYGWECDTERCHQSEADWGC